MIKFISIFCVIVLSACMSSETSGSAGVGGTAGKAGSMARFAIVDSILVIIKPGTLQTWSLADRDEPKMLGNISVGDDVETVYAVDSTLFIGSETGMLIYSLETPWQPRYRSVFRHWRSCDPVVVQEHIAFVTTRSGSGCRGGRNKLFTLDVSDIDSPKELADWDLGNPHGLGVDGNLLFIADGYAGLKIFSVLSPKEIELVDVVNMGEAYDVIVDNGHLYVIASDALYQFDYSSYPLKHLSKIDIGERS